MIPTTAQLPNDVAQLQNMVKSASAQLMAHNQTVQELIKANMDLRAALHLAQLEKSEPAKPATDNGAVHDHLVTAANADPVSA